VIHLEKREAVALVTLEHGKVNLMDLELLRAITKQFEELRQSDAQAVVLTGSGGSFSAGVDLVRVVTGGKAYLRDFLPALLEMLQQVFTFPKPVVAAVNGHAIAGGCVLACACDYRLMAEGSGAVSVAELRVGVPFPSLPLEIVRMTVPPQHLRKVILRAENFSPAQAVDVGLIDEVVAPDSLLDSAVKVAAGLAAVPANAFAVTKRLINQPALDRHAACKDSVDVEALAIWESDEMLKTIAAYLQKAVGKRV